MASVDEQLAYFQIHKYLIISVAPIAAVLVTLALSLRVYVRAVLIKAFGVDDWLLVAAYVRVDFTPILHKPNPNRSLDCSPGRLGRLPRHWCYRTR